MGNRAKMRLYWLVLYWVGLGGIVPVDRAGVYYRQKKPRTMAGLLGLG